MEFNDMVKKQRAKNNISKYDEDEGETEYRETLQELYRVIAPKIKSTSNELVNILEQVTSYETVGDFGGSEGHVIDDCIFRMRELLDSLEEGIESANNDFW